VERKEEGGALYAQKSILTEEKEGIAGEVRGSPITTTGDADFISFKKTGGCCDSGEAGELLYPVLSLGKRVLTKVPKTQTDVAGGQFHS